LSSKTLKISEKQLLSKFRHDDIYLCIIYTYLRIARRVHVFYSSFIKECARTQIPASSRTIARCCTFVTRLTNNQMQIYSRERQSKKWKIGVLSSICRETHREIHQLSKQWCNSKHLLLDLPHFLQKNFCFSRI